MIESVKNYLANRSQLENGDTLIEVMISLLIVSLCVVAFLTAFTTSISASAEHRTIVSMGTVLRSVPESAISQIQQQVNPLYTSCATPSTYDNVSLGAPSGYSATITSVEYWDGTTFSASCTTGSTSPQLIGITVTGPLATTNSISFVVDDPLYKG